MLSSLLLFGFKILLRRTQLILRVLHVLLSLVCGRIIGERLFHVLLLVLHIGLRLLHVLLSLLRIPLSLLPVARSGIKSGLRIRYTLCRFIYLALRRAPLRGLGGLGYRLRALFIGSSGRFIGQCRGNDGSSCGNSGNSYREPFAFAFLCTHMLSLQPPRMGTSYGIGGGGSPSPQRPLGFEGMDGEPALHRQFFISSLYVAMGGIRGTCKSAWASCLFRSIRVCYMSSLGAPVC